MLQLLRVNLGLLGDAGS